MRVKSCLAHGQKQEGDFCDQCGAQLIKVEVEEVVKQQSVSGEQGCPACSFKLHHGHQWFCPGCGVSLRWTCRDAERSARYRSS